MKENSQDITPRCAFPPWTPVPGAVPVEYWHASRTPLAGTYVVRSCPHDNLIVYTYITDIHDAFSVWAYAAAGPQDVRLISVMQHIFPGGPFRKLTEVHRYIEETWRDREIIIALAQGSMLFSWTREVLDRRGIIVTARDAVRLLLPAGEVRKEDPWRS
jgi:hypothetical protein